MSVNESMVLKIDERTMNDCHARRQEGVSQHQRIGPIFDGAETYGEFPSPECADETRYTVSVSREERKGGREKNDVPLDVYPEMIERHYPHQRLHGIRVRERMHKQPPVLHHDPISLTPQGYEGDVPGGTSACAERTGYVHMV